jgi:hypothetical protein
LNTAPSDDGKVDDDNAAEDEDETLAWLVAAATHDITVPTAEEEGE